MSLALRYGEWDKLPADVEVVPFTDHVADEDLLVGRLKEFDAVCRTRERTELPARVLERLPRTKLLLMTGVRQTETADLEAAHRLGMMVCGTGGFPGPAVELCWAMIMSLFRRIHSEAASVRAGGWQVGLGTTMGGRRLGLLGLGRHGQQIARIAHVFGMETIAWSPNLTDERAAAVNTRRVSKDELFAESDAVSLHMPLSPRSLGIVGARELALLRPHAFLINISRGPLIDEAALIDALQNGRIAGYAADAFDVEPLPQDHPFRYLPNVLATPHIGFVVPEFFDVMFRETVENILAYLAGSPIRQLGPDGNKVGPGWDTPSRH
jgi:phosphoglycerate dehydrogenase-like enzyme